MSYDDLIVLIPSHSLEDFPAEQGEAEAASLLNSFSVPWHPALLAAAKVLPRWHRADDPPDSTQRRLVMLPKSCESWVPAGWPERMNNEGSVVVRGTSERSEMLAAALKPLEGTFSVDEEIAADFLSLGFCYLQIELLTRKMRHFSNLDEVHLKREAVAAAEAALAGDETTARTRLRSCFEVLTEARERFYAVDCYLIDLCLLIPRLADVHLTESLMTLKPMNLLATSADMQEIAKENPDVIGQIKEAWDRGALDFVCGEWVEPPLPLMPIGSIVWQLARGRTVIDKLLGHRPGMWGRRRYGLFPQLPQFLKKSGFSAAMHAVLDDGIYPDAEQSKMRWEGTDGTVIDAISRIPLAAEGAGGYLRFPTRMSESMDNDHVAAVVFARWPEVKAPWFDDLRRMHNYSPVLGRWVTFDDFFRNTESPGRISAHKAQEYLTPYLFQSVARQEANAISRYAEHYLLRHKYDAGTWYRSMHNVLLGRSLNDVANLKLESSLEELGEEAKPESVAEVATQLTSYLNDSARMLGDLIMSGAGQAGAPNQPGYLILNPLGFRRLVTVQIPDGGPRPDASGTSTWVQWDDKRKFLTADVPGAGFTWVPAAGTNTSTTTPAGKTVPETMLAEANLLRNEFFEVHISPETGGIRQIKGYGRSPNRLSQQLNYRYSRERSYIVGEGDFTEEVKSHYAEMRCLTSEVTATGPALGEIVTTGEIIDQKTKQRLAGYRQTIRIWRGRPVVEVDAELDIAVMPDAEPWHNYYTSRFAWNDDAASLTRSVAYGAQEIPEERFESPHYVEIVAGEQRTTILTHGMPFHRKSGARMFDTILVVPKETRKQFKFTIAIDQNYPLQAALDAMEPAALVTTTAGPPRGGTSGWFFHLNVRSVQMLGIGPLLNPPAEIVEAWNPPEPAAPATGAGCALRLMETEGRPVRVKVRCFRPPARARQRDFLGKTITELTIEGDAVLVDLTAYELADVEIRFE